MITTAEAAQRLGVSSRRVLGLIHSGVLDAQRHGGVWLVDEESVDRRLQVVSKRGGRPPKGKGRNDVELLLMNRSHVIAEVVYNRKRHEFVKVGDLADTSRGPIGVATERTIPLASLNEWWRGRGIPNARAGLQQLLDEAGADVPEELVWRNLGSSLSDQYWVYPVNSGLTWEDVSFFANDWKSVSALTEPHAIGATGNASPDNTSDGNLAKRWTMRGNTPVLQKFGGPLAQEPFNEAVATALHERLLEAGEFVRYTIAEADGIAVSECANFLADHEEYVPAHYVHRILPERADLDDFGQYLACCDKLGVKNAQLALSKMIVCDDIIANHDRHWRNFGLIRDVETLECRPAPLFDSGSSLWSNVTLEQLRAGEFSFDSKPFYPKPARQLLLVEDFSWADHRALDGFVDEATGILGQNPLIATRLPYIRDALERRVRRMADVIEWG